MKPPTGLKLPKMNLVERAIGIVSPRAAMDRYRFRAIASTLDGSTGYVVGGSRRRSVRGWNPVAQTADQDTLGVIEAARASSRDLFMNTPIASGAIRRIRTNVVGSGLTLQCRIDREALGLSDEAADAWERKTEREFRLWAMSKDCDSTRYQNFYGLQALAIISTLMNGDCFALLPYIERKNPQTPYKLVVRLIEADQICNPGYMPDSDSIAGGIEVDADGAAVAYHIRKASTAMFASTEDWIRVTAYGNESGRRNILHILDRERIGQRRGMPLLSSVIEPLKQATRLSEAELMGAVISAFFTVFVKSITGTGLGDSYVPGESVLSPSDGTSGSSATHADRNIYEIGSGNIVELGENEEIQLADPKRPNSAFAPFFEAIMRQVGASIEVPYEQLMLMFTASYSASRAALLEAWKFYRMRRTWLANEFCQPTYEEWLTEAVGSGRVSAPGFFEDLSIRAAWSGASWGGPGQGQIDPVKETNGAILRIQGNLGTYEDEYTAIHGGEWGSAMVRRAREDRKLKENGLVATAAPTTDTLPGQMPPTNRDDTNDESNVNEENTTNAIART